MVPNGSDDGGGSDSTNVDGEMVYTNHRAWLMRFSSTRYLSYTRRGSEEGTTTVRAQEIRVRDDNLREAMSTRRRMQLFCQKMLCIQHGDDDGEQGIAESTADVEQGSKGTKRRGSVQFNMTAANVVQGSQQGGLCHSYCYSFRPFRALLSCWYTIFCCGRVGDPLFPYHQRSQAITGNPNQLISRLINFMFRSSFVVVFLMAAAAFYLLVCIFAGIIIGVAKMDPSCISIGGVPGFPGSSSTTVADAMELSWTTFSTVGYGSIGPTNGSDSQNRANCAFITIVCGIESLIGVLFGGFVGAIIFSKIVRIQSLALVEFSHPLVIRYGTGVGVWETEVVEEEDEAKTNHTSTSAQFQEQQEDNNLSEVLSPAEEKAATTLQAAFRGLRERAISKIPPPVLEFRIANKDSSEGGAIMDAVLNVVANQDAEEADPVLRGEIERAKANWEKSKAALRNRAGLRVTSIAADRNANLPDISTGTGSIMSQSIDGGSSSSTTTRQNKNVHFSSNVASGPRSSQIMSTIKKTAVQSMVGSLTKKDHQKVDEDPNNNLMPRRIFSKLLIEASEHPYFRRVWLARHILDDTSPLLTPRARRLVKKNHGHWPESLNTYEGIKSSIRFNQILVSLTGMSNISGSEVYAQKVYESVDTVVGYTFVNTLYRGNDGKLHVDLDLINDVREQNGGGGEPLTDLS